MQIWPLLKFLISLEEFIVWVRSWVISQQNAKDIAIIQLACNEYKSAVGDDARLAAARKIQEQLRGVK